MNKRLRRAGPYQREREMTPDAREWLAAQGLLVRKEISLPWGYVDLVGVQFDAPPRTRGRKHLRIVAVELKMDRAMEVIEQAIPHQTFATEVWVGMPPETAARLLQRKKTAELLEANGIGVLAVDPDGCTVLRPAVVRECNYAEPIPGSTFGWQVCIADRFRQTRLFDEHQKEQDPSERLERSDDSVEALRPVPDGSAVGGEVLLSGGDRAPVG